MPVSVVDGTADQLGNDCAPNGLCGDVKDADHANEDTTLQTVTVESLPLTEECDESTHPLDPH